MWYLCATGAAVAFAGLLWARFATSSSWRYGLLTVGLGLSFALATGLAAVFRKSLGRGRYKELWKGFTAACLGLSATFALLALHLRDKPPESGPPPIVVWKILAISFQIVGGGVALIVGSAALWELINLPPEGPEPTKRRVNFILTGVGVAAGLYCLSPVTRALGIPVNHWTFFTLVGLAGLVFAVTAAAHRFFRRDGSSGGKAEDVEKSS